MFVVDDPADTTNDTRGHRLVQQYWDVGLRFKEQNIETIFYNFTLLLSAHADRQRVDISFTVCLFLVWVCLYGYVFLRRG